MAAWSGGVRFAVRERGAEILVYHFGTLREAREIYFFIRDFFPAAEFVFEPTRH